MCLLGSDICEDLVGTITYHILMLAAAGQKRIVENKIYDLTRKANQNQQE